MNRIDWLKFKRKLKDQDINGLLDVMSDEQDMADKYKRYIWLSYVSFTVFSIYLIIAGLDYDFESMISSIIMMVFTIVFFFLCKFQQIKHLNKIHAAEDELDSKRSESYISGYDPT